MGLGILQIQNPATPAGQKNPSNKRNGGRPPGALLAVELLDFLSSGTREAV